MPKIDRPDLTWPCFAPARGVNGPDSGGFIESLVKAQWGFQGLNLGRVRSESHRWGQVLLVSLLKFLSPKFIKLKIMSLQWIYKTLLFEGSFKILDFLNFMESLRSKGNSTQANIVYGNKRIWTFKNSGDKLWHYVQVNSQAWDFRWGEFVRRNFVQEFQLFCPFGL